MCTSSSQLAGKGGYLESCRVLIDQHDHGDLLATVGGTQAILGPVLPFVLLSHYAKPISRSVAAYRRSQEYSDHSAIR